MTILYTHDNNSNIRNIILNCFALILTCLSKNVYLVAFCPFYMQTYISE